MSLMIALPDSLLSLVAQEADRLGFATSEAYIEDLVRREFDRQKLREMILEGMHGPMTPVDECFWGAHQERVRERIHESREA